MKQRVQSKGISEDKLVVIPPWAHDDVVYFSPEGRKNFRATYMLTEKFVVMYSGNLSPCHPLNTLLQAALRLREQPKIIFCFVGGGSEIERVKSFSRKHLLANMTFLPYQPLDQLSSSLSSADMQVVVMGDAFPGIVHPCKIYNILVVGAPILYIGPSESHIMDIFDRLESGDAACAVRHGDSDAVVNYILGLARNFQCSKSQGNFQLAQNFSKEILLPKMLEWIEMFEPSASESKRVVPCVK